MEELPAKFTFRLITAKKTAQLILKSEKNVKEATAFIGPFMIIIILLGMVSMFFPNPSVGLYAVPFIGSGIAMSAVLAMTESIIAGPNVFLDAISGKLRFVRGVDTKVLCNRQLRTVSG